MIPPTTRLVAGVLFALLTIGAFAAYTLHAVNRMRGVQTGLIDRNRKASMQLIRIQGDLNALGLALRDMLENLDGYPIQAWRGQLTRIHENLDDAIRLESELAANRRNPQQTAYLQSSFRQLWTSVDRMLDNASTDATAARALVRNSLQPQQEALSALAARLLVQNNEEEQRSAAQIGEIYSDIERSTWRFLALSVCLVAAISFALIRSNRAVFHRVTDLSNQRRELARQLIATQESTLRAISRDLHDEFGQILTAVGAMLRRAERHAPSTAFHDQVRETNVVVQETLEKIRALSQSLQPVILEEQGLAAAVQWHLALFERQTGIAIQYQPADSLPPLEPSTSIHVFRILQEALNNVARHAHVREASVQLTPGRNALTLQVEDHGAGIPNAFKPGIGLAGMRERADLLGGSLAVERPAGPGTIIRLTVPLPNA